MREPWQLIESVSYVKASLGCERQFTIRRERRFTSVPGFSIPRQQRISVLKDFTFENQCNLPLADWHCACNEEGPQVPPPGKKRHTEFAAGSRAGRSVFVQ